MNLLRNPLRLLFRRRLGGVLGTLTLTVLCAVGACQSVRADSWALLIGIDQYPQESGINRLTGADNDANALSKTLRDVLKVPADHIKTLTSTGSVKPTRQAILRELNALKSHVQPGDTVFVAYSGHGIESDGTPYLLPYDADITNTELIRDTGLPESKFMEYLKTIPAKALILVFDMCRESVDKTKGVTPNTLTGAQVKGVQLSSAPASEGGSASVLKRPEVVATFFACSPDGSSYEMPGQSRGYFSFYLEQGLRGYAADKEGKVSLAGLQAYLAKTVPQAVQKDKPGGEAQVPTSTIIGPLDGGGFVVVTVNVSTLTGIATASAKMQQALALVPELIQSAAVNAKVTKDDERIPTLMEVWQVQRKAGDTEGAKQTFASAKQTAGSGASAYVKASALCAIAGAQAEAGDTEGAKQTLAVAKQIANSIGIIADGDFGTGAVFKAYVLKDMIGVQLKAGDIIGAKQTIVAAKQTVATILDTDDKLSALCAIAEAQIEAGDIVGAKQTISGAKEIKNISDKLAALSSIAKVQAKAGDIVGAKQTAGSIAKAYSKARALCAIAGAQAEVGDIVGAKQTLAVAKQIANSISMDDATQKSSVLCDVAEAQVEAGDMEGARQTLAVAKQIASTIYPKLSEISVLASVTMAQLKAGDTVGAKQTIASAKQAAALLLDEGEKSSALGGIAYVQAEAGDVNGAKQTAGKITDKDDKNPVFTNIAEAQIKAGDFIGAKATIDEITDAGRKATALANLASTILDAAKKESDDTQKQAAPAPAAILPATPSTQTP